jgi:hypothetical protein
MTFIYRSFLLFVFLSGGLAGFAQTDSTTRLNIGIEQDALPYITGGYFAGAWAGIGHIRVRAITARVHKPDFIIKKGFTNNRVTAYALLADYFLRKGWSGWWAGSGIVYWKNTIQSDQKAAISGFDTWLLSGNVGYNFKLYKHLYISPWAAMHIRIGGASHVVVDGKTFKPPLLNPEASVKLGIYF